MTKTSFGLWLKQRRKALDLTREELAQRLGCAVSTLYKIEADERRPSKQLADQLADHLNIPADERSAFVQLARTKPATPTLGSLPTPTNLSAEPTILIGRDEEVASICERLLEPEVRLLTLIGPPGIGKTRLGLAVAAQMLDHFPDGVFLIALAPITDPDLVMPRIANTLGIQENSTQTPLEQVATSLKDKQLLLVLDNMEQLLPAAPRIAALLAACSSLKLLVTSRAPLRIRTERQIPLSPLAVPDLTQLPAVHVLTQYAAIKLFVERAQSLKPDFSLTPDNAPTVSAICARLDGLPLAIELISARIKLLPPKQLLARLNGQLMLQSDGLRDIEPRHRTLNAAIDWSYHLLNTEEQTLFRRLGVFVGGCTLEAVEAVCMETLTLPMLDGLASLLDKNLLKQDVIADGTVRFSMLETIREYALARLTANGELDTLRERHADYFAVLVEHIWREEYWVDYSQWLRMIEADLANLRSALTQNTVGLRLAISLGQYWLRRDRLIEGRGWLSEVLVRQRQQSAVRSLTASERSLQAKATRWLAIFCTFQGDWGTAFTHYEECLRLFRELGDESSIAKSLCDFGMLLQERGDYDRAAAVIEEGLAIHHLQDDRHGIAYGLYFRGTLAYTLGNLQQAATLWEQSLLNFRPEQRMGHTWGLASVLALLAMVMLDLGETTQSRTYLVESLSCLRELDERWQTFHTLETCARFAVEQRRTVKTAASTLLRAARLYGAAEALRDGLGAPMLSFQQSSYERGLALLRARLNNTALTAAWAEGRLMTPNQALDYALAVMTNTSDLPDDPAATVSARPSSPTHPSLLDPLSNRELEVLRLIADGLSNAEIAERLYLSVGTVKAHVRSIFSKLGVTNRTQAVLRAQQHNLF